MIQFGLTGGIACGKSSVQDELLARGIPVLDADHFARLAVAPGAPALAAVAERFGPQMLLPDGSLDRKRLGAVVFADPAERRALEAITWPAIFAGIDTELARLAEAGEPFAVVANALLVETGRLERYHRIVVVTCRPEVQLARLMARDGSSREAAQARISAQLPAQDRLAVADRVIDNSADLPALRAAAGELAEWLRSEAASPAPGRAAAGAPPRRTRGPR